MVVILKIHSSNIESDLIEITIVFPNSSFNIFYFLFSISHTEVTESLRSIVGHDEFYDRSTEEIVEVYDHL